MEYFTAGWSHLLVVREQSDVTRLGLKLKGGVVLPVDVVNTVGLVVVPVHVNTTTQQPHDNTSQQPHDNTVLILKRNLVAVNHDTVRRMQRF